MTQPFGAQANKDRRQPQAICGNFPEVALGSRRFESFTVI
jgi:hypothetical protein